MDLLLGLRHGMWGLPGFTVTSDFFQVQVVEDKPEGTDGRRVVNNGDVGGERRANSGTNPRQRYGRPDGI
ncbi:hypothetical protein [Rhizobium azibense]|uniref:hypothetical protein n=1 Tax=Rhizobium azibense TaxID=1136135 RepID=UPI0010504F05|nr:hypothetical protein [Rhizobium azibense]